MRGRRTTLGEQPAEGFSPEGLRRLGRIVGLDESEVVEELEIDSTRGSSHCFERLADCSLPSCRSGRQRRRSELAVQRRRSVVMTAASRPPKK